MNLLVLLMIYAGHLGAKTHDRPQMMDCCLLLCLADFATQTCCISFLATDENPNWIGSIAIAQFAIALIRELCRALLQFSETKDGMLWPAASRFFAIAGHMSRQHITYQRGFVQLCAKTKIFSMPASCTCPFLTCLLFPILS